MTVNVKKVETGEEKGIGAVDAKAKSVIMKWRLQIKWTQNYLKHIRAWYLRNLSLCGWGIILMSLGLRVYLPM